MNTRVRTNGNVVSPKFKGVVPQSNGHWGAQIYANHQRIWLGTFKSEIDAAMAYDSASIKLRTGDNQRNFPWSNITVHEPKFQTLYNADAILNMIRDGSYQSKFAEFIQSQIGGQDLGLSSIQDYSGFSCKLLFQKVLTPSDVGKLNRLVVPKKYAVKYFPRISNGKDDNPEEGEKTDEVHLVFYDNMMRQWKFRYCYWQSSQSFVFTKGWNKFVKEKKLNEKDTIAFYVCDSREKTKEPQSFWLIDIVCSEETTDVKEIGDNADVDMDLDLHLGQQKIEEEEEEEKEEKLVEYVVSTKIEMDPKKSTRVRLFGVEIN